MYNCTREACGNFPSVDNKSLIWLFYMWYRSQLTTQTYISDKHNKSLHPTSIPTVWAILQNLFCSIPYPSRCCWSWDSSVRPTVLLSSINVSSLGLQWLFLALLNPSPLSQGFPPYYKTNETGVLFFSCTLKFRMKLNILKIFLWTCIQLI